MFVASPSDTQNEREICEKVLEELNQTLGDTFNFRVESLKWEKDVRPVIKNTDGQNEINEQIGQKYEMFIGIMNKKFGSPTPRAGSGTEEEFNNAFLRYKEEGNVEVMFYFNDEPPKSMSEINIEELSKVRNFKNNLGKLGIYSLYYGIVDFEEKLRKHLTKFLIDEFKKKTLHLKMSRK